MNDDTYTTVDRCKECDAILKGAFMLRCCPKCGHKEHFTFYYAQVGKWRASREDDILDVDADPDALIWVPKAVAKAPEPVGCLLFVVIGLVSGLVAVAGRTCL